MAPIDEINMYHKKLNSFRDILTISNHYNINKDLFYKSYFRPSLDLNIEYLNDNNKIENNVYYGNRLAAKYVKIK